MGCGWDLRSCYCFMFVFINMKSWLLSYILRIFGSHADIDTRRRAACDLVRGLCKFFEGPVTGIFSGYVNSMLQEYAKNPSVNWKHKDAAIYLVTSLASKAQTQKVILLKVLSLFLKQVCPAAQQLLVMCNRNQPGGIWESAKFVCFLCYLMANMD